MEKQYLLKVEEEPKKGKGGKGNKVDESLVRAEREAFVSCLVVFIFLAFLFMMLVVYLSGGI